MSRRPARCHRAGALCAWLLALAAVAPAPSMAEHGNGDWGLAELMAARAEVTGGRARFREEHHDELLAEPVERTGTLVYRAPDYVRKTVTGTDGRTLEVHGDRVRVGDGDDQRRLHIHEHPALAGAVAAFRATLAGDLATLREHYAIRFQGGHDDWTLTYRPTTGALAERLERIVIRGRGRAISEVETRETDGSWRLMRISRAGDGAG
ncbi:hypothetical protein QWY84_05770 [Aquisalimonas lutea]|uniref:LolA-related protein n=1 Tax=Aquisalimonas lutea TaxID=1327750 RepID=UPI0025B4689D|nr:LolA-related protein [Aquisalimonas lutea]MDN3517112.1 hypothetical protein [Aquisalimonas lutea]